MINYNIHGIISVSVEDNVDIKIKDAIHFQIGYFLTDKKIASKYNIEVDKFTKYDRQEKVFDTFHLVNGIKGECYYNPETRVCIVKTTCGFKIYADTSVFLINMLLQFLLLNEDITMIHAAATSLNGAVTLLPGAGGVGKTILLSHSVFIDKNTIFGDDIILLKKDSTVLSFPREFVLKSYHRTVYPDLFDQKQLDENRLVKRKLTLVIILKKFVRSFLNNIPFAYFMKYIFRNFDFYRNVTKGLQSVSVNDDFFTVPVEKIFGKGCVSDLGKIKKIIFLERYTGNEFIVDLIKQEELANRIFSIINHEWVDSSRQLFSLGALGLIDLQLYFTKTYDIMYNAIKFKDAYILKIPDEASPEQLSNFFFSNNF